MRGLRKRPGWDQIVRAVEKYKKESWESFAERRGDWGRDMCLHLAREAGWKVAELARLLKLDERTAQKAISRFSAGMRKDKAMTAITRELGKAMI